MSQTKDKVCDDSGCLFDNLGKLDHLRLGLGKFQERGGKHVPKEFLNLIATETLEPNKQLHLTLRQSYEN